LKLREIEVKKIDFAWMVIILSFDASKGCYSNMLLKVLFLHDLIPLVWELGVCYSQGLKFDFVWCQFGWASLCIALLWLSMSHPQVDSEMGPI
jgi:hypothetical protein